MGSIGSMGKPIEGFLVVAIQFPVPIVNSRKDIDHNIESIIRTLHATKAGYPGVELIIFPEYSTQGLNTAKWLSEEFLLDVPGKETELYAKACKEAKVYGVFPSWNAILILTKTPTTPPSSLIRKVKSF
ncbi:hypothetical protein BTM343_15200 [Helicobacter pylori]